MFLPSRTYGVAEMIEGVKRVAAANNIEPGPITPRPDPAIEAIVAGWAPHCEATRAESLGLPGDESLDRVIQDYIDDFWAPRLKKPPRSVGAGRHIKSLGSPYASSSNTFLATIAMSVRVRPRLANWASLIWLRVS